MRVRQLTIQNFRGAASGEITFTGHTLLVGGNNAGKSTVCEALELVLGPERLGRRPVVDEHDFHYGRYVDEDGSPRLIRIEAVLLDLSEEAHRRFASHLRRWNDNDCTFIDETSDGLAVADEDGMCWALPVVFLGRYNPEEDDFEGNTFFAHPQRDTEDDGETLGRLGEGLTPFTRFHKRLCGFVFLRALRTGSRALSLQRGSLLDTVLHLGGTGLHEMWLDTLTRLRDLKPAIGDIEQLKTIQTEIRKRMTKFVSLAPGEDATAFFASTLTRDNLREVIRFFVASEQSQYPLPFQRMGTGTVNVLVFALLTFIAELKLKESVIFAMEEPEIALPPHTQRRIVRFVLNEMGQAIVTSHSPYVIEQFEPRQIVMLARSAPGTLKSLGIDTQGIKPKVFREQKRQFAEAVLSRATLVVEGATETALFPAVSAALEAHLGAEAYSHLDLAGVSVFDAKGHQHVPRYGPVFKSLGKRAFAFHDKPGTPFSTDDALKLEQYDIARESPFVGIEELITRESSVELLRRFLDLAGSRLDYPQEQIYDSSMDGDQVRALAKRVLIARKGDAYGYCGLLVAQAKSIEELPQTITQLLRDINKDLEAHEEEPAPGTGSETDPQED